MLNLKLNEPNFNITKNIAMTKIYKPKQNDTKFMMEQLQMNIDQAFSRYGPAI